MWGVRATAPGFKFAARPPAWRKRGGAAPSRRSRRHLLHLLARWLSLPVALHLHTCICKRLSQLVRGRPAAAAAEL